MEMGFKGSIDAFLECLYCVGCLVLVCCDTFCCTEFGYI